MLALKTKMPLTGVSLLVSFLVLKCTIQSTVTNYSYLVLDKTHMEYSYKHSCLITLTVDAVGSGNPVSNDNEWRLPTFDPHNETKYLYKLHTIDLYFWEKEDALLFLNAARRVLPGNQVAIHDEPQAPTSHPVVPASHSEVMSPVVQQLENMAMSDPYRHGQTRDSRSTAALPGPPQIPGPPKVPAPPQAEAPKAEEPPANFAPMAYNPAAPAAPEAIRHREKTPPPEDGNANPLVAAAASDQGKYGATSGYNQFAPPSALGSPQGMYFPGPPQAPRPGATYSAPPPSALTRTQSMPLNASYPQSSGYSPQSQQAAYPGPPGYSSPLHSPSLQGPMASPGFTVPPQYNPAIPGPPPAPSAPPGGYSSFAYAQPQAQPAATDYSIHQQVYRPTEGEAAHKFKPVKEPSGKLEANAMKLEKGVTGFLKKLEKKYG
jgi:hypothetical protein